MYMDWTFMVHVSLHWSNYGVDNLALWGFAVKRDVWLYNHIPNHLSGLTRHKLLTNTKDNHCDIIHTHVWGCTIYDLDSKLQDGQKIPKWNWWSHVGWFRDSVISDVYSSLVANVCHLLIGYVSPQYHMIFHDLFETMFGIGNDALFDNFCNHLFWLWSWYLLL